MFSTTKRRSQSQRGMTLMEALIAVFIFSIVFLTALALYQAANRAYLQTDAAAIQQQNVRFGMDRMLENLRDAGAGYNTLGSARLADEQIEGAWESAVFIRGNFDNARETALENTTTAGGYAIVTTGNDEIAGFVLRKSAQCSDGIDNDGDGLVDLADSAGCAGALDTSEALGGLQNANTIAINIRADLTGTVGGLTPKRDAVYTNPTSIAGEETSGNVMVAATTVAAQTDPPYQLARVTFNSAGVPLYEVIADNIYRIKFEYFGASGATTPAAAVITAAAGSGSADTERDERGAVRRVRVKLIGMADRPDLRYTDPWNYGADFADLQSSIASNYHKFALQETVLASNMGIAGRRHNPVPGLDLDEPTYITVCTGHCRYFHVRWPASTGTGITEYAVRVTAPAGNGYAPYDSLDLAVTGGNLSYIFKDPDTTGFRTFTFKVASASGGITGTYGPPVSLLSAHDAPNSTPNAPTAISASQAAGSNALTVNWLQTTANTASLPVGSNCATAGVGGSATQPAGSWPSRAIDLAKYKVYRLRDYAGPADGDFPTDAAHQVDSLAIGPLVNTTPSSSAASFTDRTAAPCENYFYRVKACDLCDVESDPSLAMSGPVAGADPGEDPDAPGGANRAAAVTGSTAVVGNDYNVVLNWPAVVQTESGRPAAVAHYRIYRYRALAPSTTYVLDPSPGLPIEVYEPATDGIGVAALTYTDAPPAKVTGNDASYQYYVAAVYSGCSRESELAGPYTAVSCTASNTVTIDSPAPGIEISIPFESGFRPRATVNNEAAGTVTRAVATITGPNPSNNVIWSSTVAPNAATPYTFDFDMFDTAPQQAVGTYSLNVYATVDNCDTAVTSIPIILGDATCGLNATNITLTSSSGNNDNLLSFNVQNTCDPLQGGLDFEVTGLRLSWTGFGGARTITEARLGSQTGTLLTNTPLDIPTGTALTFLSDMHQTVAAGTTSANKWFVIFSGDMKQNVNNNTSFGPISAQTTTPANANDIIVACCQQY